MLQPKITLSYVLSGQERKYLGDEGHQLSEMVSLFIGVDAENLANAIVVVPLLEKLLLVRFWVALYEILELGKIGSEEDAASHGALVQDKFS